MKVSVVLPAYLEAENLKNILPSLNNYLNGIDSEILVVDTMEPLDDTKEVCEKNGHKGGVARRRCEIRRLRLPLRQAAEFRRAAPRARGA